MTIHLPVYRPRAPRPLTPCEERVTELLAQGMRNSQIAATLGLTEGGVRNRLHAIFDKTGMWNRVELAMWYVHQHEETEVR